MNYFKIFIGVGLIISLFLFLGCTSKPICGNEICEFREEGFCLDDCPSELEKPILFDNNIEIKNITAYSEGHSIVYNTGSNLVYYIDPVVDGEIDGSTRRLTVLPGEVLNLNLSNSGVITVEDFYSNTTKTNCDTNWIAQVSVFENSNNETESNGETVQSSPPFELNSLLTQPIDANIIVEELFYDLSKENYYIKFFNDKTNSSTIIKIGESSQINDINYSLGFEDVLVRSCRYPLKAVFSFSQKGYSDKWLTYTGPTNDLKNDFIQQENYSRALIGEKIIVTGFGEYQGKEMSVELVDLIMIGSGNDYFETKWVLKENDTPLKYVQKSSINKFNLREEFGKQYFSENIFVIEAGMSENGEIIVLID